MFAALLCTISPRNATYAAFKSAFEKRGYYNRNNENQRPNAADSTPGPPPSIFPVQNVRALHGQIKTDSIALSIADVYKSQRLGALTVSGRIQTGTLVVGDQVRVMPVYELCTVKAMSDHRGILLLDNI